MSDHGISPSTLRLMLYLFVAIVSLGLMGAVAEGCSYIEENYPGSTCPSRFSGFIAMAALTFLAAAASAAIALFKLSSVIEIGPVVLAFVCNTAATAIATSPKTFSDSVSHIPILAWACELFLIAALVLLLHGGDSGSSNTKTPKEASTAPNYNPTPVNMGMPYSPTTTSTAPPPPPPPV